MKNAILSALGAVTLLLTGIAAPASASTIFTLNQDGCSSGCGSAPYGTVTLDQTSSNTVTVTLALASGERFAGTGAGEALEFNIQDAAPIFSNITSGFSIGPAPATASAFGSFLQSVTCTECQGGQSGNPVGPLTFTVSSSGGIQIDDFIANSNGYFFASDIVGTNGNTGNVGAQGGVSATPEPASMALLGLGLSGVAAFRRRVRK